MIVETPVRRSLFVSTDLLPRRYFETDHALRSHWKSKVHKRRCKALKEPAYTIEESERAAGLGREGKRPTTTAADTPMEQEMIP